MATRRISIPLLVAAVVTIVAIVVLLAPVPSGGHLVSSTDLLTAGLDAKVESSSTEATLGLGITSAHTPPVLLAAAFPNSRWPGDILAAHPTDVFALSQLCRLLI